jgi:hypothetical protein
MIYRCRSFIELSHVIKGLPPHVCPVWKRDHNCLKPQFNEVHIIQSVITTDPKRARSYSS